LIIKRNIRLLNRQNPNIVIFIIYGLLFDVSLNIYKPFAVKFLSRLGGGAGLITLFNSMPGIIAALMLLPGTLFMSRRKNMKSATAAVLYSARCFLPIIALTPFFPENARPFVFVLLISLMNFPDALSQSMLQSSLVMFFKSGNVRARAISLRNKFGNFCIPVITLVLGVIISFIPQNDAQTLVFYQIFFVFAFIIGLAEIHIFRKLTHEAPTPAASKTEVSETGTPETETPSADNSGIPKKGVIKAALANKIFRSYFIKTLVFYVTWQSGWALGSIYQIHNLGANEIWLALFAVGSGLTSFFTAGFWSRRIAKKGNQKTMVLAALAAALNIIIVGSAPNLFLMLPATCFGGFAGIGLNITLLNGLLRHTPDENRMVYIGIYNTMVNLSLGLSPLLALLLMGGIGLVPTMFVIGCSRAVSACFLNLKADKE